MKDPVPSMKLRGAFIPNPCKVIAGFKKKSNLKISSFLTVFAFIGLSFPKTGSNPDK